MNRKCNSLVYLRGSTFEADRRSGSYATSYLKRLKYYAANGFTVVLQNLEFIYAVLYDLFNQRFSLNDSSLKFCNVTYEDYKDILKIDEKFRVIILKKESDLFTNQKDIERILPSPLMNRFEKHILNLKHVSSESKNYFIRPIN